MREHVQGMKELVGEKCVTNEDNEGKRHGFGSSAGSFHRFVDTGLRSVWAPPIEDIRPVYLCLDCFTLHTTCEHTTPDLDQTIDTGWLPTVSETIAAVVRYVCGRMRHRNVRCLDDTHILSFCDESFLVAEVSESVWRFAPASGAGDVGHVVIVWPSPAGELNVRVA